MKRAASQPLLRHVQETTDDEIEDDDEEEYQEEEESFIINGKTLANVDSISNQVTCMTIHKPEAQKQCENCSTWENYGLWRQEQKAGATKLKKQLKATWAMQNLIEEQLNSFKAHYNRATGPTKLSEVAQFLMPKWAPPNELAAVYWLGDWRPSVILELLRSSAHSLVDPTGVERALAQLIHDIKIEEAVIDEEMIEIQSNCVLHLPFGPMKNEVNGPALGLVMSEFRKIHRVVDKAQNLRIKALELAVKKVLRQTDAAQFLVAFVEIQEGVHQFAVKCKSRKGPVCI